MSVGYVQVKEYPGMNDHLRRADKERGGGRKREAKIDEGRGKKESERDKERISPYRR